MRQVLASILLLLSFSCFAQDIPPRPNPPRLVNDVAHVMTAEQVDALEQKLVAYDDSTSNQIAIVTIQSTNGGSIEDMALKILRDWGVGNKKTNNGLVILAAMNDHKIYIATGYGLEGSVPDVTAKSIIENEIVPNFRSQNYYRGFDEATDAIFKAAAGEYKAPEGYDKRGRNKGGSIVPIIVAFVILLVILSLFGRGGGGGGMMSRRGYRPWIGPTFIDWGGGGSSGGGGWSGGGGGGGFGGFGGGSGGGGGAGGSW